MDEEKKLTNELLQSFMVDMEKLSDDEREQPAVTEVTSVSIKGKCTSGMPRPPRAGGITTPKEFFEIRSAISFLQTTKYPVTEEMIREVTAIKLPTAGDARKRLSAVINSIWELSKLHDDMFLEEGYRQIENDDDGAEYVKSPDGASDYDPVTINIVKQIYKIRENREKNKKINTLEPIDYSDHEKYHFIPKLLSSEFIYEITKGKHTPADPLQFYDIKPYRIVKNDYGIDPKYEAYKKRWSYYILANGLDEEMVFDLNTFSEKIGRFFGYVALKHRPMYKRNLQTTRSIDTHGEHLFKMYLHSASRSGFIGHRNASLRFFNESSVTKFHTDFFNKKKVFMKNWLYIIHEPTDEMNAIAEEVFAFIKGINFRAPEDVDIQETNQIFSFDFDDMLNINVRDRMLILSQALGVKDNRVWVDININDNGFNRVYSLMTTIKSDSRLGLTEYDVGTCQQAIMMNVVNKWDDYPLHTKLVYDKVKFRTEFMDILGCNYDTAKQHITAISNGRDFDYYTSEVAQEKLQPFFEEAHRLTEVFLQIVRHDNIQIYSQAEGFAKDAEKDDEAIDGKKKYGILFHIYTHFERQIREAMKSCFTKPVYDVHDAVYSREILDPQVLVDAVLERTGYKVLIERGELPQNDSE